MPHISRARGAPTLPPLARRWALPAGLAAYILFVTLTWKFPDWRGVPFPPLWFATMALAAWAWRRRRGSLGPMEATAIVVVSAIVLTDVTVLWTQALRDIVLYLKAGARFLDGLPVYTEAVLSQRPDDLSNYPFLYPPLTLPLFGALSALPLPVAAALWTGASLGAALLGLRWIGVSPRWSLLLLAWPPFFQGLYVGNVAVLLFPLFAGAMRAGSGLVAAVAFKLYSGLTALWLVRERRWRDLAIGVGVVAAAVALTAPLVRSSLWIDWVEGLRAYQASQALLPTYLYGFGLGRYLPAVAVVAVGLAIVGLALRGRDPRDRLARLGLATAVASPSVFAHGFLVALPAFLALRTPLVWLVLGITSCSPGLAWWIAPAVAIAAWYRPELRRVPDAVPDPWHPLEASGRPWPAATATLSADGAMAKPGRLVGAGGGLGVRPLRDR